MATARTASAADLGWIVTTLMTRRAPLVHHAPVFWRPATAAAATHRAFLESLLSDGGARAYRTDGSVLVAVRRGDGWLVDDAYVVDHDWTGDGRALWSAFADDCSENTVRLVCPTYEEDRARFASSADLHVAESWWLLELDTGGGVAGLDISLPGADAVTVAAPPIYAPPGPVLFLPAPTDAGAALPAAVDKATDIGCAAVVVNQVAGDDALAGSLAGAGFHRHCDYYSGTIRHI